MTTPAKCTYCGEPASENDHVPPRTIFGETGPSDLIRVPVCADCHAPTSKDDEYFRDVIALREDVYDNPVAQEALQAAMRALKRPQRRRHTTAFLRKVRQVDLVTQQGLYAGRGGAVVVDLGRLARVIARTIRGLYFAHEGKALPPGTDVVVWNESGLHNLSAEQMESVASVVLPVTKQPEHEMGDLTFQYQYLLAADRNDASAWLITVYQKVRFVGITIPAGPKGMGGTDYE